VGENFGELVISKFWQGKLWQMLNTCIIGRRKTSANLRVNYLSLAKADVIGFLVLNIL